MELQGGLTSYWSHRTVDGSGLHDAWMVRASQDDGRIRLLDPATGLYSSTRKTRTRTVYDATYGLPVTEYDDADRATTADDRCTAITYVRNTSAWLVDTVAKTIRHAATCSGAVLAHTETLYDGHPGLTTAPVHGNPTTTRQYRDAIRAITTHAGYDGYGRVTSATNGNGHTTSTSYTAFYAGGPLKSTTVTNAKGQETVTKLDAGRGLATSTRDANTNTTTLRYDGLGRLIDVWKATEDTAGDPSMRFTYAVSQAKPTVVRSEVLQSDAGTTPVYVKSWAYLDALGRASETQTPATGGGRTVTLTRYDDRGLTAATTAPLFNSLTAGSGLLNPADLTHVPSATTTTYDALARPVRVALVSLGVEQFHSATAYFGGAVTAVPPVGSPTTTVMDARGLTTRVEQVHNGKVVPTKYAYTVDGLLKTVTDAARNVSIYTYDRLGRRLSSHEPDSGTWSATYDGAGNVRGQTDALEHTVRTLYDQLERPLSRHASSDTGPLLASWSYDTAPHGLGLAATATSYAGTTAYTSQVDGYDSRSRPLGTTWTIPAAEGALSGTYLWSYGYDEADHVVSSTEPAAGALAAETVTTHYDALGFPRSLQGVLSYVLDSMFDGEGMLRDRTLSLGSETDPGALERTFMYDGATRRLKDTWVTTGLGELVQHDTLAYDNGGDVTRVTDAVSGQTECNRYDDLLRLVHAWTTDDPLCGDGKAPHSTFGPDPYDTRWVLRATGQISSVTDKVGRLGQIAGTRAFGYPVTTPPHPHAVGTVIGAGGSSSYGYDADGQLTSRTVHGTSSTLSWDAQHRVVAVHGPAGDARNVYDTTGARLVHATGSTSTLTLPGLELTSTEGQTSATRRYSLAGDPVAQRSTSTGVSWLVSNPQGSSTFTLPATGTTSGSGRQRYTPYGALRTDGQLLSPHGFLGARNDPDEGELQLLGARYYDTSLGRFLSTDPLSQPFTPAALDVYGYGYDNPTTHTDPTGLMPCTGGEVCGYAPSQAPQASSLRKPSPYTGRDNANSLEPRYGPKPGSPCSVVQCFVGGGCSSGPGCTSITKEQARSWCYADGCQAPSTMGPALTTLDWLVLAILTAGESRWLEVRLRGSLAAEGVEAGAAGSGQVTVLGRYTGGVDAYVGKPGFNTLDLPFKGTGRWYWSRNKAFIDDAIERGDELRLVTNPNEPLYQGGNVYQRELRYLRDRGYTFQQTDDYWLAVPGR